MDPSTFLTDTTNTTTTNTTNTTTTSKSEEFKINYVDPVRNINKSLQDIPEVRYTTKYMKLYL